MAKATLTEIKALANTYVASNKIAQYPFTASAEEVSKLVEKIALTFTLDGNFIDRLEELNGQYLPFGNAVEEWQEDLKLPTDYSASGSDALAPNRPTYRNPSYSYKLGRQQLKTTLDYYKYQVVFHNDAEYVSFVTQITKRLFDSEAVYKYDMKRELLGKYAKACIDAMGTSTAFATSTAFSTGAFVYSGSGANKKVGVVMVDIASSNADDFATCISKGKIVVIDLVTTLAKPTDESSGEAFIKAVKKDVEIAQDLSEGHSLNGNALGVGENLKLFIVQGIMPEIEVDTMAGAFHLDKIALPVETKVIKDFGTTGDTNKVWAVLMDSRGARLFEKYRAVRTQENAEGDFINYVLHIEELAHYSKNTFIRVFKAS